MFAEIALAAVLGLVRYDSPEQQPTPAGPPPSEGPYFFVLKDQWYDGSHWFAVGMLWEFVGAMEEETGMVVVRKISLTDMLKRACREAKYPPRKYVEPLPCFPGEWPGDGVNW